MGFYPDIFISKLKKIIPIIRGKIDRSLIRKGKNCDFIFIHINKTAGTSISKGIPCKVHNCATPLTIQRLKSPSYSFIPFSHFGDCLPFVWYLPFISPPCPLSNINLIFVFLIVICTLCKWNSSHNSRLIFGGIKNLRLNRTNEQSERRQTSITYTT